MYLQDVFLAITAARPIKHGAEQGIRAVLKNAEQA
jgi:hypothetical protein